MARKKVLVAVAATVVVAVVLLLGVLGSGLLNPKPAPAYTRDGAIPADAVKMTPATDPSPPVLLSTEWTAPIPMPGPVNTAGAEDSPFITPDGKTFLFFFTPDASVPAEMQLLDHVTGIWWTTRTGANWSEPVRAVLSGDLALDGCPFLQGSTLWFCSVRAGNYRSVDLYTAQLSNGAWGNVRNAGAQLNRDYQVGEMTLSPDGQRMYWGSGVFTAGTNVMYASNKTAVGWDTPFRVSNVNNVSNAFQPFVTPDGGELWFTAWSMGGRQGPAVYRSLREGDGWGTPTEIVSNYAAEPTLDSQGNLYFVHHFMRPNGTMIEADIYVAYHRTLFTASVLSPLTGAASSLPSYSWLLTPAFASGPRLRGWGTLRYRE